MDRRLSVGRDGCITPTSINLFGRYATDIVTNDRRKHMADASDALRLPEPSQFAAEIAIAMEVFDDFPNTPLSRWLEYRAYQELVQMLRNSNELPPNYTVVTLNVDALREWLVSGRIGRRFSEEVLHLLMQLRAGGGSVYNNLCRFYCEWKEAGGKAGELVQYLLGVPPLAAFLLPLVGAPALAWVASFAGLIALLVHFGILDKVCECAERSKRSDVVF
jgi:hypothetical protein